MSQLGYYHHATIAGDTIAFVSEDDLWTASVSGGIARRLTAGGAQCLHPLFSQDGSKIAFVGLSEGHPEVYVMASEGGAPKRLTYVGADAITVCGWSADQKGVFFASDAKSPFRRETEIFVVALDGGLPVSLKLGHGCSYAVSGSGAVVIGRNNNDPAKWKRYRGGTAGELWIDKNGKNKFQRLIELAGNMASPMWIAERIYFLSDHGGIGNIYSCNPDGENLQQHTFSDEYYVRYPSSDGKRIVYTSGADVFVYDPATDTNKQIDVTTPNSPARSMRRFADASDRLEHFSVHPKGHSLALISRGQPFTTPFWEEASVQHGVGSRARYRHSEWLPDGERFVVVTDQNKFEQIEIHHADQSAAPQKITETDIGRVTELAVSPVGERLVVANQRYELIYVDIAARSIKILDHSPADRISGLAWSPDGQWVAYSRAENSSYSIIRIVNVLTGKVHDVTSPVRMDFAPSFDPEGKFLYFLSNREFFPVYDAHQFELSFPKATKPYLVTLKKTTPSPFLNVPASVGADPYAAKPGDTPVEQPAGQADVPSKSKKQTAKNSSAASAKSAQAADHSQSGEVHGVAIPPPLEIDFDGIQRRILAFPVEEGRYLQIIGIKDRAIFTVFEVRGIQPDANHWMEQLEVGRAMAYDFKEQRTAPVFTEVTEMRLAMDFVTLAYRSYNRIRVVKAAAILPEPGAEPAYVDQTPGRKSGWLDLARLNLMIEPRFEWEQMFDETWRLQREHFWDAEMSHVDWDLVFKRYRSLLPRIGSRSELSDLIWEMHGELGTSHAYEIGGDYHYLWTPPYYRGFLGAELSYDQKSGGYRIDRILRGDSWSDNSDSPLARPGSGIDEGDIIVGIGGRACTKEISVDELLINCAGKDVMLSILKADGSKIRVAVQAMRSEKRLRYRAWVEANRKIVHERTNGKVGYLHIPDMGPSGFAEFHRGYLSEVNREGLIVDVRYNGGGHVSALLLEKLARKRVGYDVSRWGQPQPYPSESIAGPMVAITNQFAGSDGDIFSHCFKLYKLGPLVGKRTWGGVIGIWPRHRLVDGTMTTQPEFSFWFSDVGWSVENYGTAPDYDVEFAPHDYLENKDPQMDKALELIAAAMKAKPFALPAFDKRPSLRLPPVKKRPVKV